MTCQDIVILRYQLLHTVLKAQLFCLQPPPIISNHPTRHQPVILTNQSPGETRMNPACQNRKRKPQVLPQPSKTHESSENSRGADCLRRVVPKLEPIPPFVRPRIQGTILIYFIISFFGYLDQRVQCTMHRRDVHKVSTHHPLCPFGGALHYDE